MKNWIKQFTVIIASMLVVFICGCDIELNNSNTADDDNYSPEVIAFLNNYNGPLLNQSSSSIFDQYPFLAQLFGNPTNSDLYKISAEMILRLNYMNKTGMITRKDFTNMVGMVQRLTKYLAEWSEKGVPWVPEGTVATGEEISLAAFMGLGTDEDAARKVVLNAVGDDLQKMMGLVNNTSLYDMIEYVITGKQDSSGNPDANYTKIFYNVLANTKIQGIKGEKLSAQEQSLRLSKFLHSVLKVTYTKLLPYLDGSSSNVWLNLLGNKVTFNDFEHIMTVVIKKFAGVSLQSYEKTMFNPSAVIINNIIADVINSSLKEAAISIDFTTIQAMLKYLLTPTDTTSQVYDANGKPVYVYCAKGLLVNYYGETIDGYTDRNTGEKIPLIAKPLFFSVLNPLKGYTPLKGKDNPFVKNLVSLIYEITDLKDARYNPDGKVKRNIGLSAYMNNILADKSGKDGLYNLYPLVAVLYDLTDEQSSIESWELISWILDKDCDVWDILGIDTAKTWPVAISNIIGLNNDDSLLTIQFLQAWFRNVDYNSDGTMDKSMVYWLTSKLHFSTGSTTIDMGDLLVDIYDLVQNVIKQGISPSSETFKLIMSDLTMIANSLK